MFKTVLIAVDVAQPEDTRALLEAAGRMTEGWDCACHVATVIPNVGMAIVGSYFEPGFERESQAAAGQELAAAVSASGLKAAEHVLSGRIYDGIITLANRIGADMILIGAHQPGLGDYLLGSNAARIVRHARQSVMVIRANA